jgi:hypothetical protein
MSGGMYTSYNATSSNLVTVYNIDQFTNAHGVYVDANGDGDFGDTANGITESTKYYVCSKTATSGGQGTIKLNTASTCLAANTLSLSATSTTDGWIVPDTGNFVANRMLVHDVEPAVTAVATGDTSMKSGQQVAKFDIKADGQRDLIVKELKVVTTGSYVAGGYTGTIALTCATSAGTAAVTTTIDGTEVALAVTDGQTTTTIATALAAAINAASVVSDKVSASASGSTVTISNVTGFAGAYALSVTSSAAATRVSPTASAAALAAITNNGGIYGWELWVGGSAQTATLEFGTDVTTTVASSGVRVNSGTAVNFVLTTPVTITAGQTVSFLVKANTSAAKAGITSGSVTFGTYIPGVQGTGQYVGGGVAQDATQTLGGLRWDYITPLAIYGSSGTVTVGTAIDVTDYYPVNAETYTF